MICRHDRLPLRISGTYFHKQKKISCTKIKVARFIQPIVVIKEYDGGDDLTSYQRVHCSFKSTFSCNISTVNALNECKFSNYFRIDFVDHLIKNTNLAYRSWKYLHGAMLHAKGMTILVA